MQSWLKMGMAGVNQLQIFLRSETKNNLEEVLNYFAAIRIYQSPLRIAKVSFKKFDVAVHLLTHMRLAPFNHRGGFFKIELNFFKLNELSHRYFCIFLGKSIEEPDLRCLIWICTVCLGTRDLLFSF